MRITVNAKKPLCVAALFVALIGFVATCQASVIGPLTTTTPIAPTGTDWDFPFSFPQFNSNLGTLNSVTLTFGGSLSTTITVMNNSTNKGSKGHAQTELQIAVSDSGGNLTTPQVDMFTNPFAYTLGAGATVTSPTLTQTGTSSTLYTTPAVLAEFENPGGGTISLDAATTTYTILAYTGGNTMATQGSTGALTGTVTYNYTAVPEPSAIALLAVGVTGIVVQGFRRRKVRFGTATI
jgi:hypothetical protein